LNNSYSGEDAPSFVFKNEIQNLNKVQTSMEKGIVKEKDLLENILTKSFQNTIKPKETFFLIIENAMRESTNRQFISEIFFEKFECPSLSFEISPPLVLYSTAKTTGLVVDCGAGMTSIVPIYVFFFIKN
jgi:centractin